MITERLLSNHSRFNRDYIPNQMLPAQREARELFLSEIHDKEKYIRITECPSCGKDNFTKISGIERRYLPVEIVICDFCDFCFKSLVLNPEANKYHYSKISYTLRGKDNTETAKEKLFEERVKLFAYPRYYFITNFLKLKPDEDLIVELGCNDGANLFPWYENGFNVFGIDLDPEIVEFGKKIGLNLIYENSLTYDFGQRKPKLIILSHFLEHVEDVNKVLQRLYEVLMPDGFLFIEVPGIRSHGLRNPQMYFDIEHNYYFDLGSIERLLKKYLFKVICADEYIRVLCTPEQNKYIPVSRDEHLSVNKIKAGFLKKFIDMMNLQERRLYDLLKEGESNSFKSKVLSKLQALYFHYYYLQFCKPDEEK